MVAERRTIQQAIVHSVEEDSEAVTVSHSRVIPLSRPLLQLVAVEWDLRKTWIGITDRLTTLKNYNRDSGQRTAEILGNLHIIDAKFETLLTSLAEDIPLYKEYVENRLLRVITIAHD